MQGEARFVQEIGFGVRTKNPQFERYGDLKFVLISMLLNLFVDPIVRSGSSTAISFLLSGSRTPSLDYAATRILHTRSPPLSSIYLSLS